MTKLRTGFSILSILLVGFIPAPAHATSITWLDMSPTPFGGLPPSGSVYAVPGIGNVTLTYTSAPNMTYVRSKLASSIVGNVGAYTWNNYEYFGSIYNGVDIGPQNFTITYTFPAQSAGTVVLGTIGLGRTGGFSSTTTVNQNGTHLGDFDGGDGFALTEFIGGSGTFTVRNSQTGPGGQNPWWNSQLALIRIDDAVSSITVNQANLRGDGMGVNIGFMNKPILGETHVDVNCFGEATGSIDLTVSGGTAPYTYLWSPNGATTQDLSQLTAGTYTVTVTDAVQQTATLSVTLTQPPQLQLPATVTDVACFGGATGSIDLSVSGGIAPYTYVWTPNGETTQDLSGLAAGIYTVTVTDAIGCTASTLVTVSQPAPLLASAVAADGCFGAANGSIDLSVSGGTAPYTYLWSPGGATTEDLAGLTSGTYTVAVTDAHGCTTGVSATVNPPAQLQATAVARNVQCFGGADGSIDLSVSGGTAPYAYLWSPGGATTQDLGGLVSGTYSVTVTDANACTANASVTVGEPAQLQVTAVTTPVSTSGGSDGAVNLTVSGGTSPYSYAWSPGGALTQDLDGLVAGSYTVTVTDANGCTATLTVTIIEVTLRMSATDLLHDAFPFNEDPDLPGTVGFDTTSALIKTGRNIAQLTGDNLRPDVPGDSLVACACGDSMRVDLVFRVLPGPGNYVVPGNRASGLRRVPTSTVAAVPGDGSFWGQYLADNGQFGTPGGHHAGSWDPNTWNSARCDTAERNLFPVDSLGNLSELQPCLWSATYHEADPKYATLGIAKNRCFVVDPSGPVNSTNITCDAVPPWLSPGSGYDGNQQTKEYTKIIPDGLLTPGSHVEYFLRISPLSTPGAFRMAPDTTKVTPQPGIAGGVDPTCASLPIGGAGDTDGHRWEEFSVLPDRWKATNYGGNGMACMLYVDLDDGHGDERAWVVAADIMGATAQGKFGAHNGWHVATANGDPNDPANFVAAHGGQPGSTWDMFGVRGVDDPVNGYAGSIGSRLCVPPPGPAAGKRARIGPTERMLWTYYRLLFLTTGSFDSNILGPVINRSQDDAQMLMAFRARSIGGVPRGCFVEGASFAESEAASHPTELGTLFGAALLNPSYPSLTSNSASCVTIDTTPMTSSTPTFGALNPPAPANDVLKLSTLVSTSTAANSFAVPGGTDVVASTAALPFGTTYWTGLLDAWQVQDLDGVTCPGTGAGRVTYLTDVLKNVFGSLCPTSVTAVDDPLAPEVRVDPFRIAPNPVHGGRAMFTIRVSRPGDVVIEIYDVAGRKRRTVANGEYPVGSYEVLWDGRDDDGQFLASGIYFARAQFPGLAPPIKRSLVFLR